MWDPAPHATLGTGTYYKPCRKLKAVFCPRWYTPPASLLHHPIKPPSPPPHTTPSPPCLSPSSQSINLIYKLPGHSSRTQVPKTARQEEKWWKNSVLIWGHQLISFGPCLIWKGSQINAHGLDLMGTERLLGLCPSYSYPWQWGQLWGIPVPSVVEANGLPWPAKRTDSVFIFPLWRKKGKEFWPWWHLDSENVRPGSIYAWKPLLRPCVITPTSGDTP